MPNFLDTVYLYSNQREIDIIKRYYGFGGKVSQTFAEIARDLGISNQRVNQIFRHAFGKFGLPSFNKADMKRRQLLSDSEGYMLGVSSKYRAVVIIDKLRASDHQLKPGSWLLEQARRLSVGDLYPFLSVRTMNCLKAMDLQTLGDVEKISPSHMLRYRNFGRVSLGRLMAFMASIGLSLGGDTAQAVDTLEQK